MTVFGWGAHGEAAACIRGWGAGRFSEYALIEADG